MTVIKPEFSLVRTTTHLELQTPGDEKLSPLYIDFLAGKSQYRRAHSSIKGELIAKAVGVKSGYRPTVIDATAGLGRDAFVLASCGCAVLMLERSPIIAALLEDGLQRLNDPTLKLSLLQTDALSYLAQLVTDQRPEVIYIDPMHPPRNKSALVKKEMRILRAIVGDDLDASALFKIALTVAKKRVVVKQPRLTAGALSPIKPDIVMEGSSTRFEIYLRNNP